MELVIILSDLQLVIVQLLLGDFTAKKVRHFKEKIELILFLLVVCPEGCYFGNCVNGTCVCSPGWGGPSCSQGIY